MRRAVLRQAPAEVRENEGSAGCRLVTSLSLEVVSATSLRALRVAVPLLLKFALQCGAAGDWGGWVAVGLLARLSRVCTARVA